jgi:hypothetical protein
MTLLADSRTGSRGGVLPWALLASGSAASLAANMAVAEPTLYGRLIAAWPSFALIGAYELLMRQVRQAASDAASRPAVCAERDRSSAIPSHPVGSGTHTGRAVGARHRPSSPTTPRLAGPRSAATGRREVRSLDADLLARARQIDAEHLDTAGPAGLGGDLARSPADWGGNGSSA